MVFDGKPVFAPIAGTNLTYTVNANWPIITTRRRRATIFFDELLALGALREGPAHARDRAPELRLDPGNP